jgi:hypothetical protein
MEGKDQKKPRERISLEYFLGKYFPSKFDRKYKMPYNFNKTRRERQTFPRKSDSGN